MSLIGKIEQLIKREKTTPERKRKADKCTKSSNEILSELFGAFNAAPPKIVETAPKKAKKSKKKHKKEKKKRSRSDSSSSDSDKSDCSHRRKRKKKCKVKKRQDSEPRSPPYPPRPLSPVRIKTEPDVKTCQSTQIKTENDKIKLENVKTDPKEDKKKLTHITYEINDVPLPPDDFFDASLIPMPDLRFKLENRKLENPENDKTKGKIQIKNLKFSAVFEETVKKAEEEARKKAEKKEDGEYTDSSSSSVKGDISNSQFPKSSDPGGILKKQMAEEKKLSEDDRGQSKHSKHRGSSHKTSRRDRSGTRKRSRSRSRRSRSRSRSASRRYHRSSYRRSRSRHRSTSRSRHRSTSRSRHRSTSRSRHRSTSRPRHRSSSRSRRRSTSRTRVRARPHSPRHRARRSRSANGMKLADSEKKRLLEVARRNAINMLKNGAVPAGAAALPPHTRNQVMAAIQSGGKSVDELTDFCKHLSKKEALGELSSVSSNDEDMSENEDTIAFHHPFLVKEKAPIVMNIRGGAPLPVKSSVVAVANKEELRIQFPVSSGSQHRQKACEWVPVSPKKDNMQVAKLSTKSASPAPPRALPSTSTGESLKSTLLALPGPSSSPPSTINTLTTGIPHTSLVPALPVPGPQAYPPGVTPSKMDLASMVSEKIASIRKEQEQNELVHARGFGWSKETNLGQFTGSTGAQILTPRELASGTQAWAKKDQLVRAAPMRGGMGMHLLQKMGWTPGQGLGKEGTGTLQPLLLEVKLDTKGLQAKEEAGNRHSKGVKQQRFPRRGGQAPLVAGGKHPVSLLGEYCSKQKLGPPEYNLCFECGPDHKKNFLFKVKVAGVEYQPAVASANKKQAKADTAQLALQKLGIVI